jgi:hypothetical protein
MIIGIGFGLMFVLNILLWLVVISDNRQSKRELKAELEKLEACFFLVSKRFEKNEKRIKELADAIEPKT